MRLTFGLLLVFACAVTAAAAFTAAFDPVRTELNARKSALSDDVSKTGKKQYAAVVKTLAKLDALDTAGTPSLAGDLKAGAAVFAANEKAFKTDFPKGTNGTGALATADEAARTTLTDAVELGFNQLTTSIGGMPAGKLKTSAQKQADAAGKALGAADVAMPASKAVKQLQKAQTAILKGKALVGKAPAVNAVTATIGTNAYVGANNYFDYTPSVPLFTIISNANTASLGGFASFQVSTSSFSGVGDYAVTGTLLVGTDPGNTTSYYISPGTVHVTEFDSATGRAAGTFTLTVAGHPEYSSTDGAFDFHSIRVQ